MTILKTLTVEDFYTKQEAAQLTATISSLLNLTDTPFGKEVSNFNFTPANADELFSKAVGFPVVVDIDKSGVFRFPELLIHFEEFESLQDWMFVVAIQPSTFNLFTHVSGSADARSGYKFNYRNLFEWDLKVNYLLEPGQAIFFRPWLFHSFDHGLIQTFRLKENR